VTRAIREDFLHQNAFDDVDTYTSMEKQLEMMETILHARDAAARAMSEGVEITDILGMKAWETIAGIRNVAEDNLDRFAEIRAEIDTEVEGLIKTAKGKG
jgi:V/A-type H+-transporting ATPase subunit A